MRTRIRIVTVAILATCIAIALNGCSDPKAAVAGTYELDKAALKAAAEAEVKAKGENDPGAMGMAMMIGMLDQMTMTMTLNADGTATMLTSMMGQSKTASGTWTLAGSAITITAAEAGETPEAISGTVSGDTISLKPPDNDQMPFDLKFIRKKA